MTRCGCNLVSLDPDVVLTVNLACPIHGATVLLESIKSLHRNASIAGGAVTGYCAECDWQWPCPTAHLAHGWGDVAVCAEQGWCSHAGVPLTKLTDSDT